MLRSWSLLENIHQAYFNHLIDQYDYILTFFFQLEGKSKHFIPTYQPVAPRYHRN